MSRTGTLTGIVAGLNALVDEIGVADGGNLQRVGWRGQQAHTPPSAWINLTDVTTSHEQGGRILDRLPFELWFTRPPAESEDADLTVLAELADLAVPLIDAALSRTNCRARLGVDRAARTGFRFTTAASAQGEGAPLNVPALVIPVAVQWPAVEC